MSKIVVTGGSGLVGQYLQKKLTNAMFLSSEDYDLTIESEVKKMFTELQPTRIIHLAAKVGGIIDNIQNPISYLDDNILMNTYLLKYSKIFGVERFTAVLSSCAYPEHSNKYPMEESTMHDGKLDENTFSYGLSKRVMATQIDNYNFQYKTNYNYIIPCNIYGKTIKNLEVNSHFVTSLINKIVSAKQKNQNYITLFGDGKPKRQLLYAEDLSLIIKKIVELDITESFNVAPSEVYTIHEISKIALDVTNSNNISVKFDKTKPNGQYIKTLSTSKFKKLFPNFVFTTIGDGIKKYFEETNVTK
jgi:GDP-L-fucose synthase